MPQNIFTNLFFENILSVYYVTGMLLTLKNPARKESVQTVQKRKNKAERNRKLAATNTKTLAAAAAAPTIVATRRTNPTERARKPGKPDQRPALTLQTAQRTKTRAIKRRKKRKRKRKPRKRKRIPAQSCLVAKTTTTAHTAAAAEPMTRTRLRQKN